MNMTERAKPRQAGNSGTDLVSQFEHAKKALYVIVQKMARGHLRLEASLQRFTRSLALAP